MLALFKMIKKFSNDLDNIHKNITLGNNPKFSKLKGGSNF